MSNLPLKLTWSLNFSKKFALNFYEDKMSLIFHIRANGRWEVTNFYELWEIFILCADDIICLTHVIWKIGIRKSTHDRLGIDFYHRWYMSKVTLFPYPLILSTMSRGAQLIQIFVFGVLLGITSQHFVGLPTFLVSMWVAWIFATSFVVIDFKSVSLWLRGIVCFRC